MAARDDLVAGIRRVSEEAAGLLEIQAVMPGNVPELLGAALLGDPEAARLAGLVCDALRRIERAPKGKGMLCVSCPRTLRRRRFALVFAVPRRDAPHEGVSLAVCDRCGPDHAAVMDKAGAGLRKLWPDLRALPGPVHSVTGHA